MAHRCSKVVHSRSHAALGVGTGEVTLDGCTHCVLSVSPPLLACTVSADILTIDDGGAVFHVKLSNIHLAWWVVWIGKAQKWVREQMLEDEKVVRQKAVDAVVKALKERRGGGPVANEEVEPHIARAQTSLLKRQPELQRFEKLPPALMVVFDIRARLRVGRREEEKKKKVDKEKRLAAAAPEDDDDSSVAPVSTRAKGGKGPPNSHSPHSHSLGCGCAAQPTRLSRRVSSVVCV